MTMSLFGHISSTTSDSHYFLRSLKIGESFPIQTDDDRSNIGFLQEKQ